MPNFNQTPQEAVHDFWDKYFTKKPGKVTSIFPRSLYASLLPHSLPRGASSARNAAESYEAAAKECRDKVDRIVKEAHRINEKFTDPDFNIESDWYQNCLKGLIRPEPPAENASVQESRPGSVHRIDWIFDDPKFTRDGYSSSDIKQGCLGDCWWVAAVATIANRRDLMNKICVARDEQVGVYGFVFYRDGEWISVVVDDNLYLARTDFNHGAYDPTAKHAREYKQRYQTGSEALYFAQCQDQNETWLPLLEKAYAKAHGDYEAIEGGSSGQGVEDMTGGVSTVVNLSSILNKDKFWKELVNADGDFVFACSVVGDTADDEQKGALPTGHAYSILKATEEVDEDGNKVRLVLIRNPWGERGGDGMGEWNGPWSDGSKEWTPYWLKKLGHTFGNDGIFWMSFQDVMRIFKFIYRTRLFDEKWTVVQQWNSINVGWIAGYLNTKFIVEVKKAGTVVVVLSQLDERYFKGFTGQYEFDLHFILRKEGEIEHICRARPGIRDRRSVSCEIDLEPGRYEVLPKITAERYPDEKMVEDIVKEYADKNPAKLRQVGMQYDLAHAKGGVPDEDDILIKKKDQKKQKEEDRKKKDKERARRERRIITTTTVTNDTVETKTEQVGGVEKDAAHRGETSAAQAKGGAEAKEDSNKDDDKFEDAVENAAKTEDEKKKESMTGDAKAEDAPANGEKEGEKEEKKEEKPEGTQEAEGEQPAEQQEEEAQGEETVEESEEESDEEEEEIVEYEEGHVPWNAVCVVGLRVYSQDPEVTVTLAETKDAEEGASLVVDSQAVGATM